MSKGERGSESGLDLRWTDHDIRPQDDLYGHVNGLWLSSATIPEDRAQHGTLHELRDEADSAVRTIIEEWAAVSAGAGSATEDHDGLRIGTLYVSFRDADAVEALGTAPLRPLLDEIVAAPDRPALARVLGQRQREGLASLFWLGIAPDAHDSTVNRAHLSQAGLGLPDEAYYRDERHADTRDSYRHHLARLAALAELPEPDRLASLAYELEERLAAASSDAVTSRDAETSYNPTSWTAVVENAGGFDWQPLLAGLGATEELGDTVIVAQPQFLASAARLWSEAPLEQWKAWLAVRVVSSCATYLTAELAEADFDFYGRTLSGIPTLPERWRRGVGLVEAVLGDAVGRFYVERHFSNSARERAVELVDHIIEAYRRSLAEVDWMGSRTRERALAKLDRFNAKIGYPDSWKDYTGLDIRPDDLLGNVRRAGRWRFDEELGKLGRPVDRGEWLTTPQTVNAFYNPRFNEVVFPAAVLRPPLFDPDADPAMNYGGIGSTIGHEICHGFDDQGAKYDGSGNLRDWWDEQDRERFMERTRALVAQYDALHPTGFGAEHTVNGELTLGENIGDLSGLTIAIRAYQLAVEQRDATQPPTLDGLTGVQRVLFSWAQTWRATTREAETIRRLAVDPHAPPDIRCNAVVTNLDAFHEAFDVTETDALFTPESERIRIW